MIVRAGRRGAKLRVTNHPIGGPVFSGPQLQPWKCQATAVDAQCNQPPAFSYVYKSSNPAKPGLQAYDPANPPADVAPTTTDEGVTVPFIVRLETGYIDRDQYQIATLFQPGKPWTAVAPQRQFNHKLLITHGFGCGADHQTGTVPSVLGSAAETALARGFATMANALDHAGHNCNLATQAESLVMTKEYLIERYGTLRYTIGTGCSGGSLAQQWIANAYPGIYQGILPTCSFPDAWSTATQFLDYHLTLHYLDTPSKWGAGVTWTDQQMADVQGHVAIANSQVSDAAQFHVVIPTDPCAGITGSGALPPGQQPRRRALHDPGRGDQRVRPAPARFLGPAGEAARSRLRRRADRQRRSAVRPGRAAQRQDQRRPVRRPQREDRRARRRRLARREPHDRGQARAGQRVPQRDDQRDQQPRPHRDHRLPRTRRGRSSTTPTARSRCGRGSTASTAATPTS